LSFSLPNDKEKRAVWPTGGSLVEEAPLMGCDEPGASVKGID